MINSRSIDDLLPIPRKKILDFIAAAEHEFGCYMLVTSTYRDRESQNALYAIGRRGIAGEKIVTNAKGGDSWHNYRCAADIVPTINGIPQYNNTELLNKIGALAIEMGLTWGGDWNANGIVDKPDWDRVHFQWTGGVTLAQLQSGTAIPQVG